MKKESDLLKIVFGNAKMSYRMTSESFRAKASKRQQELFYLEGVSTEAIRLKAKLIRLGEDSTSLPDLTPLYSWKKPPFPVNLSDAENALGSKTEYLDTDSDTDISELEGKLNEQNALLKSELERMKSFNEQNSSRIEVMQQSDQILQGYNVKFDSVLQVISNQRKLADELNKTLKERYEKRKLAGPIPGFGRQYESEFHYWLMEQRYPKLNPEEHDAFQVPPKPEPKSEIIEVVEPQAEFPGGMEAMRKYIADNLRLPEAVTSHKVSGRCYLKFTISDQGIISEIKVVKGVMDCPECDAEAIRVVRSMPNWTPAENNNKPVKSYYNLPIKFESK